MRYYEHYHRAEQLAGGDEADQRAALVYALLALTEQVQGLRLDAAGDDGEEEMQRRIEAHETALGTEAYDHVFEGHGE